MSHDQVPMTKTAPTSRRKRAFSAWCYVLGICLTVLAGCGQTSDRCMLEGTVTVDGQPLAEGNIRFLPQPGTGGPSAGGKIMDGRFSIARLDGTFAGEFRVEITASRKTGRQVESPFAPGRFTDESVQYLPAQYNSQSELTAQVTDDGANRFEFTLSSQ